MRFVSADDFNHVSFARSGCSVVLTICRFCCSSGIGLGVVDLLIHDNPTTTSGMIA